MHKVSFALEKLVSAKAYSFLFKHSSITSLDQTFTSSLVLAVLSKNYLSLFFLFFFLDTQSDVKIRKLYCTVISISQLPYKFADSFQLSM